MLNPRLVLINNFTVKIVKEGDSEEGSDGSMLCNCCEVPTHVAERIGLVEDASTRPIWTPRCLFPRTSSRSELRHLAIEKEAYSIVEVLRKGRIFDRKSF